MICVRSQNSAFLIQPHVPSAPAQYLLALTQPHSGTTAPGYSGAQEVAAWPGPAPQPLGPESRTPTKPDLKQAVQGGDSEENPGLWENLL